MVVVGVPLGAPSPKVGGLEAELFSPLFFESKALPFPVPGMSDVMPYKSTRFSAMGPEQLALYRKVWAAHLKAVIHRFQPHLIHTHHIWLMSALLKQVAPDIPVITHCHATGFRQMILCPHLKNEVIEGCRRHDHFVVLHSGHARELSRTLKVPKQKVSVVGAGYSEALFHNRLSKPARGPRALFVGKYSAAKGLPWLLDALEILLEKKPSLELHVAGSGSGAEAEALRGRMEGLSPSVVIHGLLEQRALAGLMRSCAVIVLPSLYEGVPLVLIEALACGCRVVATELPGVMEKIHPVMGDYMESIPLPRLESADRPRVEEQPAFVENIVSAMERALVKSENPLDLASRSLEAFSWGSVFERIEKVWRHMSLPRK